MTGQSSYSTLYKVIVLYFLSKVEQPLSKTRILDFILERDYTDYLTIQTVFSELSDNGLVSEKKVMNRTLLSLTEEGRATLNLFQNELTDEIRRDIDLYLRDKRAALKQELAVTGDYHLLPGGSYMADLTLRENNSVLLSLSLPLPTEELARDVCDKWKVCHEEVYALLMEKLL